MLLRHGPAGIAQIALHRFVRLFRAHETHTWYALDLDCQRPRRELPAGFELRLATPLDLAAIERLPGALSVWAMERGIAAGHQLWMVGDGDRAAFACWIYILDAPVMAARGGWLNLPPGVVCAEDSVTSPTDRGRGIAPAAWSRIGNRLAEHATSMITKVEIANEPSRRAVEKAGFQEIATMTLDRQWLRTRVAVRALDDRVGQQVADRIVSS